MEDDDEELAEDEEEILVYVEFDGSVAGNTFSNEKLTLDMIGLDKEHPIMQVNGKYYEGTYQDVIGTYMFFEKDENPPVDDPVFDAIPTLKYRAKTRKLLKMQRIFVEPKTELLGDSNEKDCVPNIETISKAGIPMKYQEAALKSWENMRNERIEGLNKYLEKQRIREEKRSQGIEPDSESDEDNPFAMYKPHVRHKSTNPSVHFEENPDLMDDQISEENDNASGQDSQTLTVIDPGPSTSKNSQPWSSPSAENREESRSAVSADDEVNDTYHINLPNVTSKHKATVKVMRKGKIRKHLKTSKKKSVTKKTAKRASGKSDNSEDEEDPDDPLQLTEYPLITDNTTAPSQSTTKETSENTELTKNIEVLDTEKETTSTDDKRKVEKQQKREEKMRLLSEKLKKAAEDLRMKTNQRSDETSSDIT